MRKNPLTELLVFGLVVASTVTLLVTWLATGNWAWAIMSVVGTMICVSQHEIYRDAKFGAHVKSLQNHPVNRPYDQDNEVQ